MSLRSIDSRLCARFKDYLETSGDSSIVLKHYYEWIALLRDERNGDADAQCILDAMDEWGQVWSGIPMQLSNKAESS